MKLLLIEWLLCHALDHFCSDECMTVFVFGSEDVPDVCDGSCTLGVELVMCLTTRLICVLLELMSDSNNVEISGKVGISCGHCCLGWNECTHPGNLNNEQGRNSFSGSNSRVKDLNILIVKNTI